MDTTFRAAEAVADIVTGLIHMVPVNIKIVFIMTIFTIAIVSVPFVTGAAMRSARERTVQALH